MAWNTRGPVAEPFTLRRGVSGGRGQVYLEWLCLPVQQLAHVVAVAPMHVERSAELGAPESDRGDGVQPLEQQFDPLSGDDGRQIEDPRVQGGGVAPVEVEHPGLVGLDGVTVGVLDQAGRQQVDMHGTGDRGRQWLVRQQGGRGCETCDRPTCAQGVLSHALLLGFRAMASRLTSMSLSPPPTGSSRPRPLMTG